MRFLVLLMKFDLKQSSLKTCLISEITKQAKLSRKRSFKLPKQGMMLNGHVYQRQMYQPSIRENVGGLLPTPRASLGMDTVDLRWSNVRNYANYNLEAIIAKIAFNLQESPSGAPMMKITKDLNAIPHSHGLSLNPQFLCELMGYPKDWLLSCEQLATL